jgi:tetratricopeptide (TPR) repeat protein
LGVGSIALGFIVFQKSSALIYYNQAVVMANTPGSSVDAVEANLTKAINLAPIDVYYRSLADLELSKAQTILNNTGTPSSTAQTDFQTAISKSIAAATASTQVNPFGYSNWTELGSVYEALVPKPLAVQGAYDNAMAAYVQAQKLNPKSPEPDLLMARLELDNSNVDAAQTDIQNALTLKNDYADAYFLLTQLDASANNIPDAIKAAQTASLLSPDNAGVFFELGLLQYTNADYADAVTALTQAITITPNYANAEYFLGLSLDKLDRPDDALAQFENLAKTNPNNADIEDAIANIQAGKDALYKAPSGAHPEQQAVPPVGSSATQ